MVVAIAEAITPWKSVGNRIKVINMPNPVTDPQQQARENMQGARPHGANTDEPKPPNLYYDQTIARQTFHPPAGVQTNNGYVPIQNRPASQQPAGNGRQVPPRDPRSSNTRDVMFMESTT